MAIGRLLQPSFDFIRLKSLPEAREKNALAVEGGALPAPLSRTDELRLRSWIVDIARTLVGKPGQPAVGSDEIKFPAGLQINRKTGRWCSFTRSKGGRTAVSLIHFLKGCSEAAAIEWGRSWLASHDGYGSPIQDGEEEDEEAAERAEGWQGKVGGWGGARVPIAGPVLAYLHKRALVKLPDPADALMIPAHIIGPGLIGLAVTVRINGASVGFQLLPLDAVSGAKVGRPRLTCFTVRDRPDGPITFAPLPPPAVLRTSLGGRPLILCEGWENQESLKLALPEMAGNVVGVAGVDQLKRVQVFRGCEVVICRDGDPKGSPADKALVDATDALILGAGQ